MSSDYDKYYLNTMYRNYYNKRQLDQLELYDTGKFIRFWVISDFIKKYKNE